MDSCRKAEETASEAGQTRRNNLEKHWNRRENLKRWAYGARVTTNDSAEIGKAASL